MTGWDSNPAKMDSDTDSAVVALVLPVIFSGGILSPSTGGILNLSINSTTDTVISCLKDSLLLFLHPFVFCARMQFIQGAANDNWAG